MQNLELVYEHLPRLKERKNQLAKTLSGGERQMLAIGRGLMSDPKLMLFDELSLGLEPHHRQRALPGLEGNQREGDYRYSGRAKRKEKS